MMYYSLWKESYLNANRSTKKEEAWEWGYNLPLHLHSRSDSSTWCTSYSLWKESYLVTHHRNKVNKIVKIHEAGFIWGERFADPISEWVFLQADYQGFIIRCNSKNITHSEFYSYCSHLHVSQHAQLRLTQWAKIVHVCKGFSDWNWSKITSCMIAFLLNPCRTSVYMYT